MGIDPTGDLAVLLISQLHHDHGVGLHHFPDNRIQVRREHDEHAVTFQGKLIGF